MKIAQARARIVENKKIVGNYWHLEFESGLIARQAIPGQFVNIKVSDGLAPLLRRPLSIHKITASRVRLIYEVLGQGTQALSKRKPGEQLDIIGPLGKGFDYSAKMKKVILVAGGMGVAPLVFLADKLKADKPLVLIGARTKGQIICVDEFKSLGLKPQLATDDGSSGFKGRITGLLSKVLSTIDHRPSTIYACGPRPMLKAAGEIAAKYKLSAQLSLEEHMACGIGACLGCVVSTKSGYRRVCKDGPVFLSEELIW